MNKCGIVMMLAAALVCSGCPATVSDRLPVGEPGIPSLELTATDYQEVTRWLVESLLIDRLFPPDAPKMVAYGGVDTLHAGTYSIDTRQLQDILGSELRRSERLRFSSPDINPEAASPGLSSDIYNLRDLLFESENSFDAPRVQAWLKDIDADYYLRGWISAQTLSRGRESEVTYFFSWALVSLKKAAGMEAGEEVWKETYHLRKVK